METELFNNYKKFQKCYFKGFKKDVKKLNKKGVTNKGFVRMLNRIENVCFKKIGITRKEVVMIEEQFEDLELPAFKRRMKIKY